MVATVGLLAAAASVEVPRKIVRVAVPMSPLATNSRQVEIAIQPPKSTKAMLAAVDARAVSAVDQQHCRAMRVIATQW